MDRGTAIQTVYKARNFHGTEGVVAAVERGDEGNLFEGLDQAVKVLGESRTRQVLGLKGGYWITLYTTQDTPETEQRQESVIARLQDLWEEGKIAAYSGRSAPKHARADGHNDHRHWMEAFHQYRAWAGRHQLNLEPFFTTRDNRERAVFPDLFLVARSQAGRLYKLPSGDRDTSVLEAVFPCSDGEQHYVIEDYLDSVETETHWLEKRESEGPTIPDSGTHGAIKGRLFRNPGETVGEEWTLPSDEYPVELSEEDRGWVDIVFQHRSEKQYMLVEVKPDADKVDDAFGQVGRYKHQFVESNALPHLTADQVHVAIAAPEFHDSHRRLAEEWGVNLIEVGGE